MCIILRIFYPEAKGKPQTPRPASHPAFHIFRVTLARALFKKPQVGMLAPGAG